MTEPELITALARAIAHQEGFFDKPKKGILPIAQRCNNPGNLQHWKQPNGNPYPAANGYVQFPDVETGFRALKAQCKINVMKRGLTWREFFAGKPGVYAGFCPKDSTGKQPALDYARKVMTCVAGPDASDINQRISALLGVAAYAERAA